MAAINMNRQAFEQALQDNELVLMDFWAPWCPDCVRITEAYDQIAEEYKGRMAVGKVNIDQEKELFKEQGGRRIPTLILYQNGKALGNIVLSCAQDNVHTLEGLVAGLLNGHILTLEFQGLAGAAGAGQGDQLAYGEIAFLQNFNHFLSHGAGSAQNSNSILFHGEFLLI